MLRLIKDSARNVLGIEATGKVTHEDYQEALIPAAEAFKAAGPIRMLYVVGHEFAGYELEASWDDSVFWIKHWRQFVRIAVVTHRSWLRALITMLCPFFPSEVRLFRLADLIAAKTWIASVEKLGV